MARALLFFAVFATGCGSLISNRQEVEMGRGVAEQISKEYTLLPDRHPVTRWARRLTQPLIRASAEFRDPREIGGYEIHVIHDDELINAFAAPGGFLYLSTGLLLAADTCAEVAGVMSHELAHVTERHSAKQVEKSFVGQTLADLFLDEGLAQDAAKTIWSFLQATTFSREDESEADSIGLRIAWRAGYNPYGLVWFFQQLVEQGGSGLPEFLSSHPASERRVRDVSKEIRRRYGAEAKGRGKGCRNTKMSLAQVKRRLR